MDLINVCTRKMDNHVSVTVSGNADCECLTTTGVSVVKGSQTGGVPWLRW